LTDSNFFLAVTEVMSHVELLEETGDVSIHPGQGLVGSSDLVQWNGTEEFPEFIRIMGNEFQSSFD
jgi:hypothetical protein